MVVLLRVLLMIALAVISVSTAQHAHATQQPETHAADSGQMHHDSGARQEHGGDHDPTVCCPSLSLHCGAGGVLHAEMWRPLDRVPVAVSQSLRDGAEPVDALPEFEPPPPRA